MCKVCLHHIPSLASLNDLRTKAIHLCAKIKQQYVSFASYIRAIYFSKIDICRLRLAECQRQETMESRFQ